MFIQVYRLEPDETYFVDGSSGFLHHDGNKLIIWNLINPLLNHIWKYLLIKNKRLRRDTGVLCRHSGAWQPAPGAKMWPGFYGGAGDLRWWRWQSRLLPDGVYLAWRHQPGVPRHHVHHLHHHPRARQHSRQDRPEQRSQCLPGDLLPPHCVQHLTRVLSILLCPRLHGMMGTSYQTLWLDSGQRFIRYLFDIFHLGLLYKPGNVFLDDNILCWPLQHLCKKHIA